VNGHLDGLSRGGEAQGGIGLENEVPEMVGAWEQAERAAAVDTDVSIVTRRKKDVLCAVDADVRTCIKIRKCGRPCAFVPPFGGVWVDRDKGSGY